MPFSTAREAMRDASTPTQTQGRGGVMVLGVRAAMSILMRLMSERRAGSGGVSVTATSFSSLPWKSVRAERGGGEEGERERDCYANICRQRNI